MAQLQQGHRGPQQGCLGPGARALGLGERGGSVQAPNPMATADLGPGCTYQGQQQLQVGQGPAQETHAGRLGGEEGVHCHGVTCGTIHHACGPSQRQRPISGRLPHAPAGLGCWPLTPRLSPHVGDQDRRLPGLTRPGGQASQSGAVNLSAGLLSCRAQLSPQPVPGPVPLLRRLVPMLNMGLLGPHGSSTHCAAEAR